MTAEESLWSGSYLAQMENEGLIATVSEDEDWDMEAEERDYRARHQDIEAVEDTSAQHGAKYIALDTNALISHLGRIQALYNILQQYRGHQISLLIPTAVVNELDGLKSRANIESHARSATSWLLYINKAKRETGRGPVRSQKWSERLDQTLSKGDDRILDCCLFFQQRGADVVLWTADQGLSLLAEGNGTPTLSPPRSVDAVAIVRLAFQVDLQGYDVSEHRPAGEPDAAYHGRDWQSTVGSRISANEDGQSRPVSDGMDVDRAVSHSPPQAAKRTLSHVAMPSASTSLRLCDRTEPLSPIKTKSANVPPSIPSSATKSRTAHPSPVRPPIQHRGPPLPTAQILTSLDSMARYIHGRLPVHVDNPLMSPPDPTDRPTTNTARTLRTLSQTLTALHESMTTLTDDDKRNVWFAIGAINTICHFVRPTEGRAPCQEYQLRQALKDMTTAFNDLGIVLNAGSVESIIDGIRS